MHTLHEAWCTFFVISVSFHLRMRNVSDTSCRENQNTHFMFSNFFFWNPANYEIMWKNIVEPDRPQMTTWHRCIACWITKATNTHSAYVMLIAFPLQQWLHKHASILYMFIAFVVFVLDTAIERLQVSLTSASISEQRHKGSLNHHQCHIPLFLFRMLLWNELFLNMLTMTVIMFL
jgi:hypothetical protein